MICEMSKDTAHKCRRCWHHHCVRCGECHRCGHIDYNPLSIAEERHHREE